MKRRLGRLQLDQIDLISKYTSYDIGQWLTYMPTGTKLVNFANNINTNSVSMVFESDTFKETELGEEIPLILIDLNGSLDFSLVSKHAGQQPSLTSGQALQILGNSPIHNIQPRKGWQGYNITPAGTSWGASSSPLNAEALKKAQEEINKLYSDIQTNIQNMSVPRINLTGKDYKTIKKEHEQMNCSHDWATYVGLNHTDTYCKKCNKVK